MANPTNPVIYANEVAVRVPWDYQGYKGFLAETCPVCSKNISPSDRVSVLKNGKHWHIHKMCQKRQHLIS